MRNEKNNYLCTMRQHYGMRPQDIPVLLKIIALDGQEWNLQTLSNSLFISLSEISESLNRSRIAALIDYNKKTINRNNLFEFLEYGVKYVFPQQLGTMARGIATAHSHPCMKDSFISDVNYIWQDNKGDVRGLIIEPFYPKQVDAIKQDEILYKLLALIDVVRVGRVREIKYAIGELKKIILHEPSYQ